MLGSERISLVVECVCAEADEVPGCPGCGKKVRIVVEYVEAPLPH